MATLYTLAEKYKAFNEYVEDALSSDEEFDEDSLQMFIDTLESVEDELSDKVENICKFLKNIEGDIKAYKAEEARLEKKRKYLENKFNGLKTYTQSMLELSKKDKLKAGSFNVRLQNNNPSAFIENEELIPVAYRTPQPDKISKDDILADLKAGKIVEGARLADEKKHIRFS